ncbi:hypothetical protein JCM10908_001625 [Rhodotorula pacifica]|uniref:uncharacterized protein n=1 Tax=Rhodotorula pacifica TaxID=1495444 RepID=UPI00317BD44B
MSPAALLAGKHAQQQLSRSPRTLPSSAEGMESFPSEFLAHHAPLCFVAGLAPTPAPPQQPQAGAQHPHLSNDPFAILQQALRKALATRNRFPIWDNSRGANADLHTVVVDKNVRFPPLKARPASSSSASSASTHQPGQPAPPVPASTSTALHSPISPLTPSSPLYPDGLIAPIWIRKHRELVPAVFVLVLRLFEVLPGVGAPDPLAREDEERAKDAELVTEIIDRKRSTLERGIKLAVVLLCSHELLDDPQLDARLSLIRRQSGLDSRASLFVISPVPQSEVNHFVQSLRAELYPAALDYYREHGRRVRRKRARIVVAGKGGLSEQGWNVRYDYKLALFAEMRGELEVALKHFEDCYDNLVEMFAHPELLPPRTKRWAEAKVLADCVSCKISKYYFYLSEPARAVAQLNRHVARFHTLSTGWQIGQDTFEFWSWLSKQYRLFGDLVSIALRNGAHLPSLRPPPAPRLPPPGTSPSLTGPSPGLVTANILQHAGHYYHLAGLCAVERRDRFREMARAHKEADERGAFSGQVNPAFAHEAKVEHGEIIIELFTRAYEYFKAHRAKNVTYMIAHQIALAHLEAGKPDVALKFLNRITKSYRKDRYPAILTAILECSFRAAKESQNWEAAIRAGLELLSPQSTLSADEREGYATETLEIMQAHAPAAEQETIALDSDESLPLFDLTVAFARPTASIAETVDFQIALSAPVASHPQDLAISQFDIHFHGLQEPVVIRHASGLSDPPARLLRTYDLGDLAAPKERTADLRLSPGQRNIFSASTSAEQEIELGVEKAILSSEIGGWPVQLVLRPARVSTGTAKWYYGDGKQMEVLQEDASRCRVVRRDARVQIEAHSQSPAYLDERFPIEIEVTNEDDVDLDAELVVFLQPGEDGAQDYVEVDSRRSTSLLDGISLGSLPPGSTAKQTLSLSTFGGVSGPRTVELTVRASPKPAADTDISLLPAPTESTCTTTIAVVSPVHADFATQVYKTRRRTPISTTDEWVAASEAILLATLRASGPWDIEVESICLLADACGTTRVQSSSLGYLKKEDAPLQPTTWRSGDAYNAAFALQVKPAAEDGTAEPLLLELSWRRSSTSGPYTQTRLRVHPPKATPPLPTATLILPPYLYVHEQADLIYSFSNPTQNPVNLAAQLDTPEVASSFVFSGPRRVGEFALAPQEERELVVRVVPLMAGQWTLPRMRVWQIEQPVASSDPQVVTKRMAAKVTELEVDVEGDAFVEPDPAQLELEANLRTARGEGDEGAHGSTKPPGRAPTVLVLPA